MAPKQNANTGGKATTTQEGNKGGAKGATRKAPRGKGTKNK